MSSIDTLWEYLAVAVGILVVVGGIAVGLMRGRGGRRSKVPFGPFMLAGAAAAMMLLPA